VKDGLTPIKGVDYFDGEQGSSDTPDEVVEKINKAKKKIKPKQVEGLTNLIKSIDDLTNFPVGKDSGGGGGRNIEFFVITGTINGVNKIFTLPKQFFNPVICYNGQVLDPIAHYSILSETLTLTIAPTAGTLFGFGQPR
jgi:hypothetical protein